MDTFAKKYLCWVVYFSNRCCVCRCCFNSGAHGLPDVFRQLNMVVGCFTKKFCLKSDMTRIKKMKRKMSVEGKNIRKRRRAEKKGFVVRNEEKEGELYGSGLL